MLHFQRIDILTGINIAVHLMVLNKPFDILCVKRFVGLHLHLHLPPWATANQMPRSLVKGLKQTIVLVSRTPLIFCTVSQT